MLNHWQKFLFLRTVFDFDDNELSVFNMIVFYSKFYLLIFLQYKYTKMLEWKNIFINYFTFEFIPFSYGESTFK